MKDPDVDGKPLEIEKPPEAKLKPDRLFNAIIFKMMAALAFSVALLAGGGALLVYSLNSNAVVILGYEDEIISVWTFLGIHMTLLMFYYAIALFKYIVSD